MRDIKTMGSLADKLLCFVSTTLVHDSNYQIAVTMLNNYSKLEKMNLSEIADLCFVSKSAITRFCHFVGFENFKEFQNVYDQKFDISADYSKSFQKKLHTDPENAVLRYCEDINQNINKAVSSENLSQLSQITKELHDSPRIVYFSHHFLWNIGHYFQSKMMMMGRYVEQFIDYDMQLESAKTMKEHDLAIIVSLGGSYPSRYSNIWNAIVDSGCRQLIITQNGGNVYWNGADFILKCGESNQNDIGKYAALAITDMVIMDYYKRYV